MESMMLKQTRVAREAFGACAAQKGGNIDFLASFRLFFLRLLLELDWL